MFHECYDKNGNYIGRASTEEGAKNLVEYVNAQLYKKEAAEQAKRESEARKAELKKRREELGKKVLKYSIISLIGTCVLSLTGFFIYINYGVGEIYGPDTTYGDKVKRTFYWVTPNFVVPEHATEIGNGAFKECRLLKSVTLPNSVTYIAPYAFLKCSSLKSVTISESVSSIGEYAFGHCSSLVDVYCKPIMPPMGGYGMFFACSDEFKIHVPTESVFVYKDTKYWANKNLVEKIVEHEFTTL